MTATTADSFVFVGAVVPKERPRFGKSGRVYTPPRTAECELRIGWAARQARLPKIPKGVKVALAITFQFADNRDRDGDNLLKTVMDALNGIAYDDDKQIKSFTVHVINDATDNLAAIAVRPIGAAR